MKHKIVKETKPTLKTFGKYKAKAVHNGEVGSRQVMAKDTDWADLTDKH